MTDALPHLVPVDSSNIEAIGHDSSAHELHVKFRNGGHYVYSDVHPLFYRQMLEAKSPGAFHAEKIKDVFAHRKL